jgi:hypothetical protein
VEQTTTGSTSHNVEFLNQISGIITSTRDATSADGSVNQADASKRLTQYIHQVTGTDIVSDVEFDAGFVITGKATAGAQATIQWRLDKDRTTGLDGEGAQVLSLGANDVNNDGTTDVTAQYNNATGEWSLAFAAGSAALLQATHNTWGSGVHQLVVDTDGNGSRTGSGATAEASRQWHGQQRRHGAGQPELQRARQNHQRRVCVLPRRPRWRRHWPVDGAGQR